MLSFNKHSSAFDSSVLMACSHHYFEKSLQQSECEAPQKSAPGPTFDLRIQKKKTHQV